MQLRVASWNIWTWDERKPKEIADIIRENNIDIIGLQEVATYFEEDGKWNMAEEIAKELDYNYRFCVAHDFRPDESLIEGNAVISRYPIETTLKKN